MERNKTLDIAKGLLMLLVIFGHLSQAAHYSNTNLGTMEDIVSWYYAFYMGAFFIISGYLYNTNKPFAAKIKNNFRRILFPVFTLSLLSRIIFSLYHWNLTMVKEMLMLDYWINFSDYWFLNALFFSKVLYDIALLIVRKKYLVFVLAIPLSILGCFVGTHNGIVVFQKWIPVPNYWCIRHTMVAFLFVVLGDILKNFPYKKLVVIAGSAAYMIMILICKIFEVDVPLYTWAIIVGNWPLFVAMALAGTLLVVFVAAIIRENHFFETLGKVSLVAYGIQMVVLKIVFNCLYNYIPIEKEIDTLIGIAILTFILSVPIIYFVSLFISECCPYIIGKFKKKPLIV